MDEFICHIVSITFFDTCYCILNVPCHLPINRRPVLFFPNACHDPCNIDHLEAILRKYYIIFKILNVFFPLINVTTISEGMYKLSIRNLELHQSELVNVKYENELSIRN
jgi:hypothetical protein